MKDKHAALLQNDTWDLVPHPSHANMVSDKWIFNKFRVDGSLEH